MFYLLISISLIFISIGIYINRKNIIDVIFLRFSKIRNKDELDKMEEKIKELEEKLGKTSDIEEREIYKPEPLSETYTHRLPFTDLEIDFKEEIFEKYEKFEVFEEFGESPEPEEFEEVYEEAIVEREELSVHNKIKIIQEYEDKNKSIDEICKLMNMKKGELLLLKKLYKKS